MSDTANHPAAIRPTTASTPAPTCIVTVVPAHDERELLPRCLRALQRAAQRSPVPVHTTVVLDACTDDTALVVPAGITLVERSLRNVGAARAAGFAASGLVGRPDVWFSTTDADSVVPDSWFVDQLTYWADHDAMAGTVRVDWAAHDGETRRRTTTAIAAAADRSTATYTARTSVSARTSTTRSGIPGAGNRRGRRPRDPAGQRWSSRRLGRAHGRHDVGSA